MKTELIYGVEMTVIESMMLSKYLSNKSIAMNTLTAEERKDLAIKWLDSYRKDQKDH